MRKSEHYKASFSERYSGFLGAFLLGFRDIFTASSFVHIDSVEKDDGLRRDWQNVGNYLRIAMRKFDVINHPR
jgi:hypothetical protein